MIIAICDDEQTIVKAIQAECETILKQFKSKNMILAFQSGEALLSAMHDTDIDILLLDIDMPGTSGMEVAETLRKKNEDILLIFVSSHEDYVFDTFAYRPFRFVRKARMKQELPVVLRAAEAQYQKNRKRLIILKCEEGEVRVEESEIMYVEMIKRQLHIYLSDGRVLQLWKPLRELQKMITPEYFSKIHSGCVVNLKYVSGYTGNEIILDNGVRLIASRDGMKVFKEELSRYWSR